MKKANKVVSDPDIRAEYDFAKMKGGARGKYAARLRGDVVMVVLAADVAPFFPTSESVNAALRAAIRAGGVSTGLSPRRGSHDVKKGDGDGAGKGTRNL